MQFDPNIAYEDSLLWLPKKKVNVKGLKAALTFEYGNSTYSTLTQFNSYVDSDHHIGVPRRFLDRDTVSSGLNVELVDLRPTKYEEIDIYSKIQLDKLRPDEQIQSAAVTAGLESKEGIISLACVARGTLISINRAGKGWTVPIESAFEALHGKPYRGKRWNPSITTQIRSHIGDRIGLQRLLDIVHRGSRRVFELRLADGRSLTLTADHKILTTTGYRSIEDGLSPGDFAITDSGQVKWGTKLVHERKPKPVYKRLHWYLGHPFAHLNGAQRRQERGIVQWVLEEHRAVAEASLNGLTLTEYRDRFRAGQLAGLRFIDSSKYDVHHVDGNIKNNTPANLAIVSKTEHHGAAHNPSPTNFGYGVPTPVSIHSIKPAGSSDVYDAVCGDPHHNFVANGVVVHNCGNGKTLIGLHLWAQRRVPLIVVTDQTTILEQWAKNIRFYISPGDIPIGRVYKGHREWDRPVVLASIQTLLNLRHSIPASIRNRFGYVIYDECHTMGAPEFSKAAPIFVGHRQGLSATPHRSDHLERVFEYHIGKIIYQNLSQPLKPQFLFYTPKSTRTAMEDPTFRRRIMLWGELNIQKLWTALSEHEARTIELAGLIQKMGLGRRTLVISQRKNLLYKLGELVPDSGVITSKTDLRLRDKILSEKSVVLGIMGIAQKGLDSPTLEVLVLCEPFKDQNLFQQVVGRLLRDHPNKGTPIVIVVQDDLGSGGGPIYGLCRKMKRLITEWPKEQGGPYKFDTLT